MPYFVKCLGKLTLQVLRQDCVCNRPADNGKLFGPGSGWLCAIELAVEVVECIADPVACLILILLLPSRGTVSECLPIFVPRIRVANFRRIHSPDEPMSIRRFGLTDIVFDL